MEIIYNNTRLRIFKEIRLVFTQIKDKLFEYGISINNNYYGDCIYLDFDPKKINKDSKIFEHGIDSIALLYLPYPEFKLIFFLIKNKDIIEINDEEINKIFNYSNAIITQFPISDFLKIIFKLMGIKFYNDNYKSIKENVEIIINNLIEKNNKKYVENLLNLNLFLSTLTNNENTIKKLTKELSKYKKEYQTLLSKEIEQTNISITESSKIKKNIKELLHSINMENDINKKEKLLKEKRDFKIILNNKIKDNKKNKIILNFIKNEKERIKNIISKKEENIKQLNHLNILLYEKFIKETIHLEKVLFPEILNITSDKIILKNDINMFKNKYIQLSFGINKKFKTLIN